MKSIIHQDKKYLKILYIKILQKMFRKMLDAR